MVRRPAACWPPVKSAAYSASPADATTHGMIVESRDSGDGAVDAGWLMRVAQKKDAADD